jgi:hypothetical protein
MLSRMAMEISGKLHKIFETKQVTERFTKRELVVEVQDGKYPQLVLFQLTGDRCSELDSHSEGDEVRIEFNLRGREWTSPRGEIRYFNSLDVWRLSPARADQGPADDDFGPIGEPPEGLDLDGDIPF